MPENKTQLTEEQQEALRSHISIALTGLDAIKRMIPEERYTSSLTFQIYRLFMEIEADYLPEGKDYEPRK